MKLLGWIPPSVSEYAYTVLLRPRPLRAAAQAVIRRLIPASLEVEGVVLVLNPQDAVLSGALALGCYERFELSLFRSLLRPGMQVLDVGANIGLFTAVAAAGVGASGRVVAVEPAEENCRFLRRTLERNALTNVTVVQRALSDHAGAGQLFLCDDNKADHRIFGAGAVRPRETVPVELTTGDALVADLGLGRVDLLKIDIQGAEELAFAGLEHTLRANGDVVVMMELWPWGLAQAGGEAARLMRFLRGLGFAVFDIDGNQQRLVPMPDDAPLLLRDLERHHNNLLLCRDPARLAHLPL